MKFSIGWRDRGHGHGDYGILRDGVLIAEVKTGMFEDAAILAASASLFECCKKALTCHSLNSDVRKLIQDTINEYELNGDSNVGRQRHLRP